MYRSVYAQNNYRGTFPVEENRVCITKKINLSISFTKGTGDRWSGEKRNNQKPRVSKKGNCETNDREQTVNEWGTGGDGGITGTFVGVSGAVGSRLVRSGVVLSSIGNGNTGDGVLGRVARESGVRGGLDVKVGSRVTRTLADRLEGKFRVVSQSIIEGISGGKFDSGVMDVVLEDNESRFSELATGVPGSEQESVTRYPRWKRFRGYSRSFRRILLL